MRSRTVLFIPDPFAPEPLPIAVVVEAHGRSVVEPIPVLADVCPASRAAIVMALNDLREAPNVDVMPIGCGPQVVFGPVHDPFTSLAPPVFDAPWRALDTPENMAALAAVMEQGRRETYGYRPC